MTEFTICTEFLRTSSTTFYCWLRSRYGSGICKESFRQIADANCVPIASVRRWFNKGLKEGLYYPDSKSGHIRFISAQKALQGFLKDDMRDVAYIKSTLSLVDIMANRKKLFYEVSVKKFQDASIYRAGKAGKVWKDAMESFNNAESKFHTVHLPASFPIAGASQRGIADRLMVHESTIRRRLKNVKKQGVVVEVEPDFSPPRQKEFRHYMFTKHKKRWKVTPNYYFLDWALSPCKNIARGLRKLVENQKRNYNAFS